VIGQIQYWFFGFRAGWYSNSPVPAAAWSSHDPMALAYYKGYAVAREIRLRLTRTV